MTDTVQHPSIKSLRMTIVELLFDGASFFTERRSHTVFSSVPSSFRSVFVLFSFPSACVTSRLCKHKVSVNTSFGAEDSLQLLQMVAEGSRYESTSFA